MLCHQRDNKKEETSPGVQAAEVAAKSAGAFARLFASLLGGYSEPDRGWLQESFWKAVWLDPGEAGVSERGFLSCLASRLTTSEQTAVTDHSQ